jgi:hypothetical protein
MRLLATVAGGLAIVEPRSALLAAMVLGPAVSGRSGRPATSGRTPLFGEAASTVDDDRRAEP